MILRSLSPRPAQGYSFSDNVLIIAPHPDDEVLGCGGLIARAIQAGKMVNVIILSNGGASHRGCCTTSRDIVKEKRRHLATVSLEILGISQENIIFLDWEDGRLPFPDNPDFASKADGLAKLLAWIKPAKVLCPHYYEGWADHVAAQQITREAIKRSGIIATICYYCVWFWFSMPLRKGLMCDWKNALTLDISGVYEQKRKAIAAYMEPCAPCGKPWSGSLPKEFLKAFAWKRELFFKVERL